ncbi:SDR family NAD(P)-dependent oxidoreductase [Myceligenerans indicum]|uniref:SDR family oxidoreductase n=1 Tax=Myceligenerans indicum TaxID=2593663 RepID=A0ABS1LLG0_9MICO|nr:SDR family oxidoreductase [Myceligenerans indicum]MBL0887105.1 SDR family oxidoreductase [Myceligenerans indicum]
MQIKDRTFVVTGGGNGIGREVVLSLLRGTARVAAIDLSEPALAETAKLAGAGDRLTTHAVDIVDRSAVLALPNIVASSHGPADGLVNVAGIIHEFKPVVDLPFEVVERVMNVNFWGTVNTTKAFLPALLDRPQAALVNVSSMGGLVPVPGQSAYGASKAAVKLFTEGLIAELKGTSVQVSVVFPGGVATDITAHSGVKAPPVSGDQEKAMAKLTTPQEAARQVVSAVWTGRRRVIIGGDARMLDRLGRLMPTRAIDIIADRMKNLVK